MLTFDDLQNMDGVLERGLLCSAYVTRYFTEVLGQEEMLMEFEKAFYPYLQEGKKRYAGRKYEPDKQGKSLIDKGIDCKGIETERSDTLPLVKQMLRDILHELMERMDETKALHAFELHMQRLCSDEVPFDMYIMKKTLSSKVMLKTTSIVQAKVNADRRAREAGSEASAGEKVEYVIVNGHRNRKTTEMAEDPRFAKANNLKINRLWYFEHAIIEPVRKIFIGFPNLPIQHVFRKYKEVLNAKRLCMGTGLQRFMIHGGRGGGGGGSGGSAGSS